jgi:hypothetical protein
MLGEIGFESLGKLTAGQHDPSATSPAFKADIRAQADHSPFIGAAGMLFSQAQVVVQLKIRKHVESQYRVDKAVKDYILNCDKLPT